MSGLILPGDDVHDIARYVKDGDPIVGWRGDPTMDVYAWPEHREVAVYGFDRAGGRYVAARASLDDPGWRHDLLRRLRDGDWQTFNVDDFIAEQDKVRARKEADADDQLTEDAEKLAWALRRDVGAYVDGLTREFYPVGG